jgi:hypothetical protein
LFVAPYYAAGNGCNGAISAGCALGGHELRQRKQRCSGKHGMSYRFHSVFLFEIASVREVGTAFI